MSIHFILIFLSCFVSGFSWRSSLSSCRPSLKPSFFSLGNSVEQKLKLFTLNMQLSLHLLVLDIDVIVHLENTNHWEALTDELRDLTKWELGSLLDLIVNSLLHHFLGKWLLELHLCKHVIQILNIWESLVKMFHFFVELSNLRECLLT